MSFESYTPIMTEINACIRPGKSVSFTFEGDGHERAERLFLTGETNISPYWKTEPDYQMLYRRIDDSLRSDVANRDRFCLDLSGKPCSYPKIAFKKLVAPFRTPMFYLNDCGNPWSFGISDSHKPLVVIKRLGEGEVYFVNAREYAGSKAVELAYREAIRILTEKCLSHESIYAEGDRNVQFAVYEREDGGREIYFIATDWHRPNPDGVGRLIVGADAYEIPVSWGQLVKVVAHGESVLYPERDENEVISLNGTHARVQGSGIAGFILCRNGACRRIEVDFTRQSVQNICIE